MKPPLGFMRRQYATLMWAHTTCSVRTSKWLNTTTKNLLDGKKQESTGNSLVFFFSSRVILVAYIVSNITLGVTMFFNKVTNRMIIKRE